MHIDTAIQRFFINRAVKGHIFIAFSGGIDSHVLLHSLAKFAQIDTKLTAVYIHHGLQEQADAWQDHCAGQAEQLHIAFQVIHVNAHPKPGQSPEEAARDARYHAFKDLLKEQDIVVTGQHAEDQMETILLQMFRGSGLAGLAGMPEVTRLGEGYLIRPFLQVEKSHIQDYAQRNQLQWIEDPSNQWACFDRNFLRNQVIPILKQRWPALQTTVNRSGRICAESDEFIKQIARQSFKETYDDKKACLLLEPIRGLSVFLQTQVIRMWFSELGLRMPSSKAIENIIREVINARPDSDPVLQLGLQQIRRYRQQLYCIPVKRGIDPAMHFTWPSHTPHIILPANGELSIHKVNGPGLNKKLWRSAQVEVCYRQGGEVLKLPGRQGRQSLKKLLQAEYMPSWERKFLPLIYLDGQLAAVADLWIDEKFYSSASDENLQIHWQKFIPKVNDEIGGFD